MRTASLSALAVLCAARLAAANECETSHPIAAQPVVPLGCPAAIYLHGTDVLADSDIAATIYGPPDRDVRGAVQHASLTTAVYVNDESCHEDWHDEQQDFTRYVIDLHDVQPGDTVALVLGAQTWQVDIGDAGPCATDLDHEPTCNAPVADCGSDDPPPHDKVVECDAGGGSQLPRTPLDEKFEHKQLDNLRSQVAHQGVFAGCEQHDGR